MPTLAPARSYSSAWILVLATLCLLVAVGPARGHQADCPLGTFNAVTSECDLNTAETATGTMVFGHTLHMFAGGSITALDASGFTLDIAGDFIMEANSELSGDQAGGCPRIGAPITVQLNGGDIDLKPGSYVHSNSCSGGFIQLLTSGTGVANIDGVVESVGSLSGTGANQGPGGGPITIIAGCELTISDAGVVSSRGENPGADLVHLEGCIVVVNGLVESTGKGHGLPNNPANSCSDAPTLSPRRNPVTRPGKPADPNGPFSTGCVEIWSGTTVVIDSTGSHKGEVNADVGFSGGTKGVGWIEIFANGNISILDGAGNDASGTLTFAVHSNGGIQQTNDNGGLIDVTSVSGDVLTSGLAIQASTFRNGGRGGVINVLAGSDVQFGTATIEAKGANQGGGNQAGGLITARAFNGSVTGTAPGLLNADGGGGQGVPEPGVVTLQGCGTAAPNDGVNYTGTVIPAPANILADACGGSPTLPAYVLLPDANCQQFCVAQSPIKRGVKFSDLNNNNQRDAGEPGLANWTIKVFQGGAEIASTTTDGTGNYQFILSPGTYVVCEVLQAGWTQTFPVAGVGIVSCAALGADLAPLGYQITLVAGQIDDGNDFGNHLPGGDAECPEDPKAVLTRVVDTSATAHNVPKHAAVQDAWNNAQPGEVIGIFSNTVENIILGGTKSLKITQCTTAQVTAADPNLPVWNITTTGILTIIGPDSVGGTVGWRIQTDGHDIRGVRATGASLYGIQVIGDDNEVSFNEATGNGVGVRIEGDDNDVRGGTVSGSTGDGVQIAAGATGNEFRTANVQQNGGNGIVVEGSGNTVRDNGRVDNNTLNGILVSGDGNLVKNNKTGSDVGKGNTLDGVLVTGVNNTVQAHKANANGLAGIHVGAAATGTRLKGNHSNQTASGGNKENAGPEYRLDVNAINQGGNRADTVNIPSAGKCPTFPAAGDCE